MNVKDADAIVTVICPSSGLCPEMRYRIEEEKVVQIYHDRKFQDKSDLEGFDMVLTALDDIEISRSICYMCRELKIPVNVADVPPECDFYFGSLIRRGPLQIMISTGGKGPRIANQVRRTVEQSLPDYLDTTIEKVGVLRGKLRKKAPDSKDGPKRMRFMIEICEKWNWNQLAKMDEQTMEEVLKGWEIGKSESPKSLRGVVGYYTGADWKDVKKRLFGTCPVVGVISPWMGGALGFSAGVAATSAIFLMRRHN